MARKVYVGSDNFTKRDLPTGYTQVEYIESSGTQYVDTGFVPNQDTKLEVKFQTTQTSGAGIAVCDTAWQNNGFGVWCNASMYGNDSTLDVVLNGTDPITVVQDKNVLYKNGEIVWTATTSTFQTVYTMTLMALHINGAVDEYATGKLYYCKLWDNGTLVRDFVPCVNSSGAVGLYDMVNCLFYGNAGTGVFANGSTLKSTARNVKQMYVGVKTFEKRNLPSGYTQVDYIQSSGTQWINTLYCITSQKLRFVCNMAYTGDNSNGVSFGGGARDSYIPAMYQNSPAFWVGSSDSLCPVTMEMNVYHTIDLTANNGTLTVIKDGVSQVASYSGTMSAENPISIFAQNTDGKGMQFASISMKYFMIYDNDILVRDYVPCINPSGAVGMYDMVNSFFYANAGTGAFAVGTSAVSVARMVKKAYIGIGGVARPFWGDKKPEYYGTITPLSEVKYSVAGASIGDYALFAGGIIPGVAYATVDTYNKSLTKSTATNLSTARGFHVGASVGDYALFAGGGTTLKTPVVNVDAYDTSLVKTNARDLSTGVTGLASTTTTSNALFAGGRTSSKAQATVCTYTKSLTFAYGSPGLNTSGFKLAGASVGDYALFAGGESVVDSSVTNSVTAYEDYYLTRIIPTELSQPRCSLAGASIGDYALFAGGSSVAGSNPTPVTTVDAYNKSLTRSILTSLSIARYNGTGETLGDYALFAFGSTNGVNNHKSVDIYDKSLTKTFEEKFTVAREQVGSAVVGDYALFGGGGGVPLKYDTVEAYVLI